MKPRPCGIIVYVISIAYFLLNWQGYLTDRDMNLETAAYFATVRAFVAGGKLNFVSQMQKLSPVEERLDTMVSLSA